jgi:AcrR family transcriptional regulator
VTSGTATSQIGAWADGAAGDAADRPLIQAAVRCVARWGIRKTSLDDIAREAGVSRATAYRVFPGGKDRVVEVLFQHRAGCLFQEWSAELEAAPTLEDLLVVGVGLRPARPRVRRGRRPLPAAPAALPARRRGAGGVRAAGPHGPHVRLPARGVDRPPRSLRCPPTRPHLPLARPRTRCAPASGEAMSATNEELIGRADVNDLEAILAVTNTDVSEAIHTVEDNAAAIFTWDYEKGSRPALNRLYEKAKTSQWNGETDLPWDTDVDQEAVVMANATANMGGLAGGIDPAVIADSPFANWSEKEWIRVGVESQNWTLSQFMHGEQGALLCTAKIVETVPWIDAKYYASTQVMDEARHVEVFAKYLDDKLSGHYPINAHLKLLLDDIVNDSRWDMTYLGMQIMVEGLALAAFGFIHQLTTEPLLKQLLRYVMSDEARHVAFGVLSLKEYYAELTDAELAERQEFAFEAAVRMRDRFLQQEVWDRMGLDVKAVLPLVMNSPQRQIFQSMLFSKIVPNCKKLGLLDANGGWLRTKFTELGVIGFEDNPDTGEEYSMFQLAEGEIAG